MFQKIFFSIVFVCCIFGLVLSVCAEEQKAAVSEESYLSQALAFENLDNGKISNVKLPNIFEVIIRFLFALLILVACIYAVAFCYNRFFNGKFNLKQSEAIRVLEHRFLDAKRSLYLVDVAGKLFVLGSGGESLNLITEITDSAHVERVADILNLKADAYKTKDFNKVLSGLSEGAKSEGASFASKIKKNEVLSAGVETIKAKINSIKKIINER